MVDLFDRDSIEELLREVGDRLAARGTQGHLFVVGGAAMALAYGRRRATHDVDAVFEPKDVIYEVAGQVAAERGLAADWLNDGVKGFLVGTDPDATVHLDEPGLRVEVASPRYLFVLKAMAARVERDARDLLTLYDLCGFRDLDEALNHVQQHVPRGLLRPKTEFLLRELLEGRGDNQPFAPHPIPQGTQQPSGSASRAVCGAPLPRGGTCTEGPGHTGPHRRRRA